jgi:hypothetical protein
VDTACRAAHPPAKSAPPASARHRTHALAASP